VQEEISSIREENHCQKKIFTSYRRKITCSRRKKSFVAEDILLSLLLQKIRFLGVGFFFNRQCLDFSKKLLHVVLNHFTEKSFHRIFLTERPFDRNTI
jgi:hypothetical protein